MHSGHTEPKGEGEGEDAKRPEYFDGPHSLAHAEPCSQERAQTGWSGWSGAVREDKEGWMSRTYYSDVERNHTE